MKNMTKEQAIEAMKEGKRVTHAFFMDNEWIKMEGTKIISEDGISVPASWFWVERSTQGWSKGWGLYQDHPSTASGSAPKEHPDFNEWIEKKEGKDCLQWPVSDQRYLKNRLFWAFDAGRNCVWHQYINQKKELESAKEALKELLPIAEKTFDSMARHEIIYAPVKMDKVEVAEIIEKARKLLSK